MVLIDKVFRNCSGYYWRCKYYVKRKRDKIQNIKVDEEDMSYSLFVPWFNDDSLIRQQELNYCLIQNCKSGKFKHIFVFPESENDKLPKEVVGKINIIQYNKRITYKDILSFINARTEYHNHYNIIANSDIIFDNSLHLIKKIPFDRVCLALTRWEYGSNPQFNPNTVQIMTENSQDAWIFKGRIKPIVECDFYFGLRGCDSIFAWHLNNAGYKVYNPSKDIKANHYHCSERRTHTEETRLQGHSLVVPIISIEDIK